MKSVAKKLKYEDLISSVEETIEKLESGELELEESLKYYENALESIEKCRTILDSAVEKFEKITNEKTS